MSCRGRRFRKLNSYTNLFCPLIQVCTLRNGRIIKYCSLDMCVYHLVEIFYCYTKQFHWWVQLPPSYPSVWKSLCPLTSTLVWAWPLISATLSPDELSTQDRAPYSMETGTEGGRRWTRCSIGLLAQPRVSDMARNPTSPLGRRKEREK